MTFASESFLVRPTFALVLWFLLAWFVIGCGVLTALKGRWSWLLAGGLLTGLPWIYSAMKLSPTQSSVLARRAAKRADV